MQKVVGSSPIIRSGTLQIDGCPSPPCKWWVQNGCTRGRVGPRTVVRDDELLEAGGPSVRGNVLQKERSAAVPRLKRPHGLGWLFPSTASAEVCRRSSDEGLSVEDSHGDDQRGAVRGAASNLPSFDVIRPVRGVDDRD
jgi:hypothetical protein